MNVAKSKDKLASVATIITNGDDELAKALIATPQEELSADDKAALDAINALSAKLEDTQSARQLRLEAIFAKARELGRAAGIGSRSLFENAMLFQKAVVDGDMKADNAGDLYDAYAAGKGETALENADSRKAQVATLMSYGKPGAVACYAVDVDAEGNELGVSLYRRVEVIWGTMSADDRTGSKLACYYAVNRAVNNLLKDLKGDTRELLAVVNHSETGDDFLRSAMLKKGVSEKDRIAKFETLVKSMRTLGKNEFAGDVEFDKMLKFADWLYSKRAAEDKVRPQMD